MAQARMIREGFLSSDRVAQLNWRAECFFHRLLLTLDDYGRMDARPAFLKSRLFPVHENIGVRDVEGMLQDCAAAGLVKLYQVEGKPYLEVPRYGQRVQAASRFPDPPSDDSCADLSAVHGEARCGTVKHRLAGAGDGIKNNNKGAGNKITGYTKPASAPAPPDSEVLPPPAPTEWMAAMRACHAGLAQGRPLPKDVKAAADAAAARFPDAPAYAELLKAFMEGKVDYIGQKEKFYRPRGQRKFFEDLEDVVSHAEEWKRCYGWKPKAERRVAKPKTEAVPDSDMTEEERAAMVKEFHDAVWGTGEKKGGDES